MIMNNYPIAAEALDLEIYQLACIFASSKELAMISAQHDSFKILVDTFELSEASKKLISIAVALRSALDSNSRHHKEVDVGTLIKDTTTKKEEPLKLREACNKIIHASEVEFFDMEEGYEGLHWSIRLFGTYFEKTWEVTLDVAKFIESAHRTT